MRSVASLFVLPATLLAACAGVTPPEPVPPPAPPPPVVTAAPTASAPAPTASAAPEPPPPPAACPANMVLIEGDYCSEVEHTCVEEWWGKANKKRVCEKFDPKASRCVGSREKKRYCIDKFEYPNQEGERPEVMNRFHQAEVKCASVGKRLCTESEWTFACEGPNMTPFPYGYVRDAKKCNGDHMYDGPNMDKVAARDPGELARLWKGVRSGSQPDCVSAFGVADLPGNADEIASTEKPTAKYDSATTGGPWYKGVRNQCRPKIYTHNEDFYYYYLSFRCCAEADGKPTDPRTPMQRKQGWKFEKVEKSAQFTIQKMQEIWKLKQDNKCACAAKDILCKTMCGTLLGPGAVDATH